MVPSFLCAALAATTVLVVASFARGQTAPWLLEPAPASVDRTPVLERGISPTYFSGDGPADHFGVRPLLGGGVRVAPGAAPVAAFALDVGLQGAFALNRGAWQWLVRAELAYSLFTGGGPVEQVVGFGVGLALAQLDNSLHGVTIALVPRVVFGSALGDVTAGERTALSIEWVGDGPLFEAAVFHEVLATHEGTVQDVGIVVGLGAGIASRRHEVTDAQ